MRMRPNAAANGSVASPLAIERPRLAVAELGSFALRMRAYLPIVSLSLALMTASCRTGRPTERTIAEWPGSQVFKLPQEGGFQWETLELKDGRFRYLFASDVVIPNPPKYPIEGGYELKGDQLTLSSGQTYTVRTVHGTRTLWRPAAVDYWNRHQVIDVYGILLPVEGINSREPTIQPLFTKEQWDRSGEQVSHLDEKR